MEPVPLLRLCSKIFGSVWWMRAALLCCVAYLGPLSETWCNLYMGRNIGPFRNISRCDVTHVNMLDTDFASDVNNVHRVTGMVLYSLDRKVEVEELVCSTMLS